MARYREVAAASGVFVDGAEDALVETPLGQIWADHLLALSMGLHSSGYWRRARFVLVYADANPSWRRLAEDYQTLLTEDPDSPEATFATATFDETGGGRCACAGRRFRTDRALPLLGTCG